jgi:hypothetical protein
MYDETVALGYSALHAIGKERNYQKRKKGRRRGTLWFLLFSPLTPFLSFFFS